MKKKNKKKCEYCKIKFIPKISFQKYCCKKCRYNFWNEYYTKTGKDKQIRKKYYLKHLHNPKVIYQTLKKQHKNKVILSKEEFINWYNKQDKKCVYCGIAEKNLSKVKDKQLNRFKRLTIDRIDNNYPYALINIVLACFRCNSIKSDFFTKKEMKEIGKKYIKYKWINNLNKKQNEQN